MIIKFKDKVLEKRLIELIKCSINGTVGIDFMGYTHLKKEFHRKISPNLAVVSNSYKDEFFSENTIGWFFDDNYNLTYLKRHVGKSALSFCQTHNYTYIKATDLLEPSYVTKIAKEYNV